MGNCFCCPKKRKKENSEQKKKKKTANKVKDNHKTEQKSIDKQKNSQKQTNISTNASGTKTGVTPIQEIESFYGKKEDIKEKGQNSSSLTPSVRDDPQSELIRTYCLPFEGCLSVKALMKHLGYEFESQVGKGGFGLVRKCHRIDKKSSQKTVLACKEIILSKKAKMIKALRSEIYVLKRCKHPYIIGLEDNFIVDSFGQSIAFLFMEFADCDTLQHEISNGPLTNRMAKHYFAQTATALTYLHRLKIAHKDLKPENILLVSNSRTGGKDVRLGDFGLSQNVYKPKEGVIKTGHFGGTRAYMAPEILRLEVFKEHRNVLALDFDPFRSDMWALGVCLFEMLTSDLPFEYHNVNNMLLLEEEKSFTYPRRVRDSIDPNADNLIRQLLEPDVAKRIDPLGVLTHPWIRDEVNLDLISSTVNTTNSGTVSTNIS